MISSNVHFTYFLTSFFLVQMTLCCILWCLIWNMLIPIAHAPRTIYSLSILAICLFSIQRLKGREILHTKQKLKE